MECIDLQDLFGEQYRIESELGKQRITDPWDAILLCKYGHIYPHGGNLLAVATNKRGPLANRLASLRCVTVTQDGDDGINAVFELEDFDTVAEIIQPRRRRRLTNEQRAASVERLRQFQFSAASDAPNSRPGTQRTLFGD